MEEQVGIAPTIKVLQTYALLLGYCPIYQKQHNKNNVSSFLPEVANN
jgi:hypothetical protein